MSASLTDKFTDTFNSTNPNVARVTASRSASGSTLTCDNLAGWPTATKVHFSTYQLNTANEVVSGSQIDWEGIVSGSTIGSLTRLAGATDSGSSIGDVVEMNPTGYWGHDLYTGLTAEHNTNGTHATITATSVTTSAGITNTGAFSTTGATSLSGSWDGWVGANESWSYASSTTITVPTDATTKYDVGDFVKLTQSSTVKIFVITNVASTVLTVSGLAGVTVANSAITANAYSKTRTPHLNGLNGGIPYNPYKFSAYASATQSLTANTPLKVQFNTENFDTGSNYDNATNYRFTAPIAGFYMVTTQVNIGSSGITSGTGAFCVLYKNGSELRRSQTISGSGTTSTIPVPSITELVQLAAGDYLEVYAQTSDTSRSVGNGSNITYFSGFLVSAT